MQTNIINYVSYISLNAIAVNIDWHFGPRNITNKNPDGQSDGGQLQPYLNKYWKFGLSFLQISWFFVLPNILISFVVFKLSDPSPPVDAWPLLPNLVSEETLRKGRVKSDTPNVQSCALIFPSVCKVYSFWYEIDVLHVF